MPNCTEFYHYHLPDIFFTAFPHEGASNALKAWAFSTFPCPVLLRLPQTRYSFFAVRKVFPVILEQLADVRKHSFMTQDKRTSQSKSRGNRHWYWTPVIIHTNYDSSAEPRAPRLCDKLLTVVHMRLQEISDVQDPQQKVRGTGRALLNADDYEVRIYRATSLERYLFVLMEWLAFMYCAGKREWKYHECPTPCRGQLGEK